MEESNGTAVKIKFVDGSRPMRGILRYKVFKNGILQEETEEKNLIVNVARDQMAHLVAGDFEGRNVTKIAFGDDGSKPNVIDTFITNPFYKNISGISFPQMGYVKFNWELSVNEANGKAISEFGLITADGKLFSRRVRDSGKPINKENDISIYGEWIIIF